eukprot:1152961-Pelagomonas_calceolata.AAC.2
MSLACVCPMDTCYHSSMEPQPPWHLRLQTSTSSHLGADLADHGESIEGALVHAVLVQVADVNLHAGVVLGLDELVGPGAVRSTRTLSNALVVFSKQSCKQPGAGGMLCTWCVHAATSNSWQLYLSIPIHASIKAMK